MCGTSGVVHFVFGGKFNFFHLIHHRKQSEMILRCIFGLVDGWLSAQVFDMSH